MKIDGIRLKTPRNVPKLGLDEIRSSQKIIARDSPKLWKKQTKSMNENEKK
jgi:hypothetical protein